MTVQTDVRMPGCHFKYLADTVRQSTFERAITAAVAKISAMDMDCRVLNLGAGAGEKCHVLRNGDSHGDKKNALGLNTRQACQD